MNVPSAVDVAPDGLLVTWPGASVRLDADRLRAACRCGACRGAAAGAAPRQPVTLVGAEPAGAYGLQLVFSDGHDRGIYPWPLLQDLARDTA